MRRLFGIGLLAWLVLPTLAAAKAAPDATEQVTSLQDFDALKRVYHAGRLLRSRTSCS